MKKYICLAVALALVATLLSGCLPSSSPNLNTQPTTTAPTTTAQAQTQPTTVPTQPTTVPTQPEDPGIELESQILCSLRCKYSQAESVEWPIVIKTVAELQEFANTDFGKVIFDVSDISDVYARFDDAFFEEHTLILVAILIKSGHNQLLDVYSAVKKDGYYYFKIDESKSPVLGPAMNSCRIWFIEVKDDVPKDATICVELANRLNAELINYNSTDEE